MSPFPQDANTGPNAYRTAHNYGAASLVLGLLALILVLTGIGGFLGIILAIIGWYLANSAKRLLPAQESVLATAGKVCSILAFFISIAGVLAFCALGLAILSL